mgnify:CR=1 FL=1
MAKHVVRPYGLVDGRACWPFDEVALELGSGAAVVVAGAGVVDAGAADEVAADGVGAADVAGALVAAAVVASSVGVGVDCRDVGGSKLRLGWPCMATFM